MQAIATSLIPLLLCAGLGVLLRLLRFTTREDGTFLLKFVTFVTLPALIVVSLSHAEIALEKVHLPLIGMAVILGCMGCALLLMRFWDLSDPTKGAFIVSTMIINNLLMFPLILARFGQAAFIDAVLFDCGNAVMVATVTYLTAFRYSPARYTGGAWYRKLSRSTLLWSVVIGLGLNRLALPLPAVLNDFLTIVGHLTAPLTLIALGVVFRPAPAHVVLLVPALFIRMVIGMGLGGILAHIVGLTGVSFVVVTLCSGAPVGFVSLSLASVARLDTEFASSAVSASVVAGIALLPLWMIIAQALV